jgi:hypothetical protein
VKFYNNIPVEKIDLIEKMTFLYWYEHMQNKGYNLSPKHTQLYEKIKHDVMDIGFKFAEESE